MFIPVPLHPGPRSL